MHKKIYWILLVLWGCSGTKISSVTIPETFTEKEKALILDADSTKEMRVLQITNYEDSVFLRKKCLTVKPDLKDSVLSYFVNRLYKTVTHPKSMGVGIAAPQVGLQRRIIWVQRFDKEAENFPFELFLNPIIKKYSDSTKVTTEGCLSIPEREEDVLRPCAVVIEYDKLDGTHHQEFVSGFTSVIFQHEIDHLDGILYIDHLKQEIENQEKSNND